jgi:(2S)-methylsuccinyl-CoA dehydrogenase
MSATGIPDRAGGLEAVTALERLAVVAIHEVVERGGIDEHQVVAYDAAQVAAGAVVAGAALRHGSTSDDDALLDCVFAAEVIADGAARRAGREEEWGVRPGALGDPAVLDAQLFVAAFRQPKLLAALCGTTGHAPLDDDLDAVRDVFHRFARDRIRPYADAVHRQDLDVPETLIAGLGELGAFGLSVPEAYGGSATGGGADCLAMVVATEELSWGSLAIGGSLITRPEILAGALLAGGTERQKQSWLPRLASGQLLAAVAVTEPDYGSDVARLSVTATPSGDGWSITGTKTWCTFAARADVVMVLARTDPDRSKGHRGLSVFMVEKPPTASKGFRIEQAGGEGSLEGRPIDTIGYRGMHSYELAFDRWSVPGANLVGEEGGLGRGFYLQMQGFDRGRLQTAARAVGVMQAAYDAAFAYATGRHAFGTAIVDYQLTRVKLTRMAATIHATRHGVREVARLMDAGAGSLEASMLKAYACRAAEWVTREAMQIHGGMGYAEEYAVSRYFVDARVLSIFEGADETLALKVIARRLADRMHTG